MVELTTRELRFLQESNAIEDILNIDYRDPANAQEGQGHVGAFLDAQRKGTRREPIEIDDLCRWQRWLTEEQLKHGHSLPVGGAGALRSPSYPRDVRVADHIAPSFREVPALLAQWVADLNARIAAIGRFVDDGELADTLGEFFQRFEAIHPFVDGNGRTGRLVACSIATAYKQPVVVFRADERTEFYRAHRNKMAMRVFMADKIREAVCFPGRGVLERISIGSNADIYDGWVVERHSLLKRQAEWRAAAEQGTLT